MIIRRFEETVERHKDKVAVKAGETALTYGELNRLANRIAYTILSHYNAPGWHSDEHEQGAALLLDKGLGQVAALLGVLKARKIYVPLDSAYPRKRLESMLRDANVRMILTGRGNTELAKGLASGVKADIIIINIDGIAEKNPGDNLNIEDPPDQIAYILYTSGSTGKPKGVGQTCGNVVFYTDNYIKALSIRPEDRLTYISSFSHDGAVQDIYASLLSGAALYPVDIRKEPAAEISRTLIKEKITVYHSVPTVFRYFADSLSGEERFSSLRLIVTGGEPLYPADVTRVKQFFPGVLLAHMYGQTESSVNTMGFIDVEKEGATITIGDALEGVELLVVKEDGEEVIGFEPGEIVVACDHLASGYWGNPGASAASFLYDEELGKVYKTGDLGRFHYSGKIEFIGRKDNQVKIRGYRVEPHEIEIRLQDYEGIKEAVVTAGNIGEIKALCAYFTAEEEIKASALRDFLSRELPEYMIPSYFMQIEKMSLTAGGKIDRNALPVPVTGDKTGYTAPRNAVEENLSRIWSEVLALGKEVIGIDSNFFELGGHSLNVMQVIALVHKKMSVKVSLAEAFERPTIRQLAQYISRASRDKYASIEPVEEKEYYPLTSAQKRMYFLQQMNPENTAYNMPMVFPLGKDIDKGRLESALIELAARHESIRTSFVKVNEEAVQRVHDHVEFEIKFFDLAAKNAKEREEENIIGHFVFPFALSRVPLIRSGLMRMPDNNHIWMVDIHHIVSDGTSQTILREDFIALYNKQRLEPLKLQYKDFSHWQNRLLARGEIEGQEAYWLELYGDAAEIPRLRMPADFKRPDLFTFEGANYDFTLEKEDLKEFKTLGSKYAATLYMNILAVLNTLFYKYTGQTDIIIGTGTAGRRHADLHRVIGMFVNTLPMRNYPNGARTYESFLKEVAANSVSAFENQDVQFEELIEKLQIQRDTSRNPLFDVSMVVQNVGDIRARKISPDAYHKRETAKFDMTFFIMESDEAVHINIEYYTAIFKEETIRRMVSHFKNAVKAVVKSPSIKLRDIDVLWPQERQQILYEFNDTGAGYPKEKTIHELFEEQAERTPGHTAVNSVEQLQIAYRELNERANRLAHLLREKGVGPDTIVGIMIERSIEMIIGMLGILKAGGAYLPIEPDCPGERIDYMLKDSGAKVLLSELSKVSEGTKVIRNHPTHLCYVIYTSGTTGRPKGVMVEHRSVVNVLSWFGRAYRLRSGIHVIQATDYTFDPSVEQIFAPLIHGATLYVVDREMRADIDKLRDYIEKHQVHIINFVPAMLRELLVNRPRLKSVGIVISGGEKLDDSLKDQITAKGYVLYNHYGPTETTIEALAGACDNGPVTLGKPLANIHAYILDKNHHLQSIGIPGELCLAGVGLARGYLNNPELTNEKFLRGVQGGSFYKKRHLRCGKKNVHRGDISIGTKYTSLALQMLPHAVGPGRRRHYKTGDLARWLADGNIEFLGRFDHQVKIRGFRIESGEIENRLLKIKGIKEALVVDRLDSAGNKYLAAYVAADDEIDIAGLKVKLSNHLPGYMIPAYITRIEKIPLTPTGKIARGALPEPVFERNKTGTAPRDTGEKIIAAVWSEVLGLDGAVGIDDNFFDLGGHSLKAAALTAKIHKELDVKVPLIEVFKRGTIRGLGRYIKEAEREKYRSIEAAEQREYYPLSKAQSGVFVQQQKESGMTAYNMLQIIPLEFAVDGKRLEQAFREMIHRHETLRTSFFMKGDEPVQRVHDTVDFAIEHYEAGLQEVIGIFLRPFDISTAPLLRVGLKKEINRHILLLDTHHIIIDGVSQENFRKELTKLYNREELPPLRLQYKDYSVWQNRENVREMIERQKEFWVRTFTGEIPVLKMPLDFERPAIRSFEGGQVIFVMDKELTGKLNRIGEQTGATLYMVLLAAFFILLSKFGSQEDIVVGSPVTGKRHADLQDILGMFVNMLAIRNRPRGNKTFGEFLHEVKTSVIDCMENQDYHFEELVVELGLQGDRGRNPLFDVVFSMQNMGAADNPYAINHEPGEQEDWQEHGHGEEFNRAKFDLLLHTVEHGGKIIMRFEFSTRLFKRATVEKMSGHYTEILRQVVENWDIRLEDIKISYSLTAMEPVSFREDGDFDF